MDKKTTILDRVIIFSEYLGMSLRSFSLSIGASAGYLHRQKTSNSNIGGDFIEKIIELYPQLNAVWLVTGEGKMIKDSYRVEENTIVYGAKDHFKEALLHYLDDQEIKDKLLETVQKTTKAYAAKLKE